jgi:outer membrane protein assembly factor BamB
MKHIRVLLLILCTCFVAAAWGQQPGFKCINSWAQFHRYDMERWNRCETVLNVNNVGSLQLKWSYASTGPVFSSPVVENGVVYFGGGFPDTNLYALKTSNGALLWSYDIGGELFGPAVSNGVVYIGGAFGVYALNSTTGALLWSYIRDGVQTPPTVSNGVVYVCDLSGFVYALKAKTGAVLWTYATGSQMNSSPAVANGVVYVGKLADGLYAL